MPSCGSRQLRPITSLVLQKRKVQCHTNKWRPGETVSYLVSPRWNIRSYYKNCHASASALESGGKDFFCFPVLSPPTDSPHPLSPLYLLFFLSPFIFSTSLFPFTLFPSFYVPSSCPFLSFHFLFNFSSFHSFHLSFYYFPFFQTTVSKVMLWVWILPETRKSKQTSRKPFNGFLWTFLTFFYSGWSPFTTKVPLIMGCVQKTYPHFTATAVFPRYNKRYRT